MASIMNRVADWFAAQCNDDWEHAYGVSIITLGKPGWSNVPFDKPGWNVCISLAELSLASKSFDRVELHRSEHDWLDCRLGKDRIINDPAFLADCGIRNLDETLSHFLKWAGFEANGDGPEADAMDRLVDWFAAHYKVIWRHERVTKSGISIGTLDNPGWSVTVALANTPLADKSFDRIELHRSEDDWLVCWVEGVGKRRTFELACGVYNLDEALVHFLDWAESAM